MQYKFSEATAKIGVDDPSLGLYSATNARVGENLTNNVLYPAIQAIVRGQSVKSWSDTVSQWKSQGGETIRTEYEKAYSDQKNHH
jgi:putative aldouronate transport system substrate-binding protein